MFILGPYVCGLGPERDAVGCFFLPGLQLRACCSMATAPADMAEVMTAAGSELRRPVTAALLELSSAWAPVSVVRLRFDNLPTDRSTAKQQCPNAVSE